jgi:pimeloyl-ACP methyl ester carboxylesterase
MMTALSADGTVLAYDRFGDGPPIVMLGGAFNDRSATEPLARALAEDFTVLNPDRRGRGDSGDTAPYSVDREIEDLDALIAAAGGAASVFGYSSGGNLSLMAAASGLKITNLVLYEPPFTVNDNRPPLPGDVAEQVTALVAADRRGDAVEYYQTKVIGMPEELVVQLRAAPFRPGLEAIAHTLAYEAAIIGDLSLPTDLLASLETPTLVVCSEQTVPFLRTAAEAVAAALPNGRLRTLSGEGHAINPDATAPAIVDFLSP